MRNCLLVTIPFSRLATWFSSAHTSSTNTHGWCLLYVVRPTQCTRFALQSAASHAVIWRSPFVIACPRSLMSLLSRLIPSCLRLSRWTVSPSTKRPAMSAFLSIVYPALIAESGVECTQYLRIRIASFIYLASLPAHPTRFILKQPRVFPLPLLTRAGRERFSSGPAKTRIGKWRRQTHHSSLMHRSPCRQNDGRV